MGFFDRFKSKPESGGDDFDPLHMELGKMKVGYYVDYDLKTWKVTAYNRYDYGEGYFGDEWELEADGETRYLEREEDDEVSWTLSRKLPIGAIDGNIRQQIIDNEDPPDQVTVKGKTYYMDESGSGHLYKDGKGDGVPFICWDYESEDGESVLAIEQWGETDFEASEGIYVEDYQFSNILPGAD